MGWVIGTIIALWLGVIVVTAALGVIATLFDAIGKALSAFFLEMRTATKSFVERGGLGALLFDKTEGVTLFVVISVVCTLVGMSLSDSWILSTIDDLGGPWTPFIGWSLAGMAAGTIISFASRVPALRAFRGAHVIAFVPDLEALRAGERAAERARKIRNVLGFGAGIILIAIFSFSYFVGNLARDRALGPGSVPTVAIDDALHDAILTLEGERGGANEDRLETALGTLRLLQSIGSPVDGNAAKDAGIAAANYVRKYKDYTELSVETNDGGAWAHASAYSVIDGGQSALWLGRLAERGVRGDKPNLMEAYEYYEKARSAGNLKAQAALGRAAEKLVSSASIEARTRGYAYFQVRADAGDPSGWLWLGRRDLKGDGVDKDVHAGVLMLSKALNQGSDIPVALHAFTDLRAINPAQTDVAKLLDSRAPEFAAMNDANAKSQGYAYLEMRGAEGDPGAQLWIGYRYKEGDGIAVNLDMAREWLQKAASQTNNETIRKRALALLRTMNSHAR
jgi:TPR repeat protein